jgi:hypothetical protein
MMLGHQFEMVAENIDPSVFLAGNPYALCLQTATEQSEQAHVAAAAGICLARTGGGVGGGVGGDRVGLGVCIRGRFGSA